MSHYIIEKKKLLDVPLYYYHQENYFLDGRVPVDAAIFV